MTNYKPARLAKEVVGRLRGEIARFDVSQAELAALCHVSQSQFSKIIRGVRPMSLDQMAVICEALDIDPVKLLEESEQILEDTEATAPAIFVRNQRRLHEVERVDYQKLDGWGKFSAFEYDTTDFTVGGSRDTAEPRQQDHDLAAHNVPDFQAIQEQAQELP